MPWTNEGFIKRSDLRLRTAYPFLETRIFEIVTHRYVIYFDVKFLNAISVSKEFADRYRFITANVSLTNIVPASYLREIDPIKDNMLSKNFEGMPFTRFDLFNVLNGKYPDCDLAEVSDVVDGINTVRIKSDPGPALLNSIKEFLDKLAVGSFVVIIDPDAHVSTPSTYDDILRVVSPKLRPSAPAFVRQDDETWFDQIDGIYSGHIKPHHDYKYDNCGSSCYIDFSSGSKQMNLRQAIMCYDTIFLTPPLRESQDQWAAQRVSDDDFLDCIGSGRIRLVLTQAEERGDTRLLEAAYERDKKSIIGRRNASAIIVGDLVQTSREYKLNSSDLREGIKDLSKMLSESIKVPETETIEFLLWPKIALRKSFESLMDRGLMGLAAISPGELFGRQLHRISGKNIQLEALILGQNAHVAHALNATFLAPEDYPPSWTWIANQIGGRLNYYRSFNTRIVAAWTGNERRREEKISIAPFLPLFEFDPDVTLTEIAEAAALPSVRREGRALISRLATLTEGERTNEIKELARRLREARAKEVGLLSLESLEAAGPLLDALGVYTSPPLFAAKNLLGRILKVARKSKAVDAVVDTISHDLNATFSINEDVDFLSKVDRVASLKRERVS